MSEETLETAARRAVRFVRIDNENHGGLLSRDTTRAIETLDRELAKRRAEQLSVKRNPPTEQDTQTHADRPI